MKHIVVCAIIACLLFAGNALLNTGKQYIEKAQAKQIALLH